MDRGEMGATLTVIRKWWDPRRLEYVAQYGCGACRRTFNRGFRDEYPESCPKCGEPLFTVKGRIGGGTWRRREA